MKTDGLTIHNRTYPIRIYIERRRNSRVSIGKKAIYIRIPAMLPRYKQHQELCRMKSWASATIAKNPKRFQPRNNKQYRNNDILSVGKYSYRISISYKEKHRSSAVLKGDQILLSLSNQVSPSIQDSHVSSLISRCIASHRLPDVQQTIHELNEKYFHQQIHAIRLKNNESNWGSCSKKGIINISTRLLFAPDEVVQYVFIHELAHLIIPNHSKQYWSLVESVIPDYKDKEQWLKEHNNDVYF